MTMLSLAVLWFGWACLSDRINGSDLPRVIRGISVPVVIFSTVVVLHHFLARDIRLCKWLLIGIACSHIL